MSQTPTALRVQADTAPELPRNLVVWADTAAKIMRVAADEIERLERDHVGAYRTSLMTIRMIEDRYNGYVDVLERIVDRYNSARRDEGAFPRGDYRAAMSEHRLWLVIREIKARLDDLE